METFIHITGVQYDCTENDIASVMEAMGREKPEVLLVTQPTHDFGIIVHALTGTTSRGVVSRFDLENVLAMMRHDGKSVLVGKVAETYPEGRCYCVSVTGDYPETDTPTDDSADIWNEWQWTDAPLMDSSPDDKRLDISLKVVLAELQHNGSMGRKTLLQHLNVVLCLAKWDVSRETQTQLDRILRLVCNHPDSEVRALAPSLRHIVTALGSDTRKRLFAEEYLPMLCKSEEAEQMKQQWYAVHKADMSDISGWHPAINRQLETIEACLMRLPADLRYQKDQFGSLMHRLLYLNIPRQKLLMLLSAIVLRRQMKAMLGLAEDDTANACDEAERQLVVRLAPIFYGKTDSARDFLLLAKGQKCADITTMVSRWVREKRICAAHCHRPLWTLLHDAGIYNASESNWNMQLCTRKSWA